MKIIMKKNQLINDTFNTKLLEILVCPVSNQKLTYHKATQTLQSKEAKLAYPIKKGIPILIVGRAQKI